MASFLSEFGHSIVFGVLDNNASLIRKYSQFEVTTYHDQEDNETDFQLKWAQFMRKDAKTFAMDPIEQTKTFIPGAIKEFYRFAREIDDQLEEIIKSVKPDFLIVDFYVDIPAVIKCNIPWAVLLSANPLRIYANQGAPPSGLGLAMTFDPIKSGELSKLRMEYAKEFAIEQIKWLQSKGVNPSAKGLFWSPFINIYLYPKSLDYSEFGSSPAKWFRMDHLVRPLNDEPLQFEHFFDRSNGNKIIFFTLGSMGSSDVDLMQKLITFLASSKHKFIVSKGPFHDEIDLPDNMIGEKYFDQLKVIQKVDLVICHGGNNSLIESLYFGKPVIIMPLFGDQHDNGRRVEDKKIGKCLYPYKITREELIDAIDLLLEDDDTRERVQTIGEQLRKSKCFADLNSKIEQIVQQHKQ